MSSSLRSDASGLLGALQVNGVDTVTFDSAGVNLGIEHPLKSIVASVASNALTVGLAATTLEFRSSTLSIGATTRLATPNLTMTIPTGATLGTTNAVQSRIILLAINNAGVVELAVVNMLGATNLDESGVISTTALTAGSTSASVIYSLVARTNVPFRVVASIDSTQAAAGTWATGPSLVTPCGGNALTSMASIGYGQTLTDVTASRALNTTYTNTTGKPIFITVRTNSDGGSAAGNKLGIQVNGGVQYFGTAAPGSGSGYTLMSTGIIPAGATYRANVNNSVLLDWTELR